MSCTLRQANYIFFLCLFPFPTSRLGKMKLWVVLQVVKFILFSSALFISYLKTPANVNVGGRISYCLCKFTTCHAPAAGKLHFLPLSFSFSHLKTRENEIVGGGIGCEIHSVQLCPFHFLFKTPANLNKGGRISYCLCKFTTCHAPCGRQITFSSSVFVLFPPQDSGNEIVGGGIGCQIHSLQFCPFHLLPQNSGKFQCRG